MPTARTIGAALATSLAATTLLLLGTALPAAAADHQFVTGNFYGDQREEVITYRPGADPDAIITYSTSGGFVSGEGPVTIAVNGDFRPVTGDFDGDGYDEVFWHAPGAAQDYLWHMTGPSSWTQEEPDVNGDFVPVSGDFTGDGADDILWYGAGTAGDYVWDYQVGGTHESREITINGTYVPLDGRFAPDAVDDVFLYARGAAVDYLLDFHTSAGGLVVTRSETAPVNDPDYRPITLDTRADGFTDILWYEPGPQQDWLWSFTATGHTSAERPVGGDYVTTAGDLFGDGYHDILWSGGTTSFWDWTADTPPLSPIVWPFGS